MPLLEHGVGMKRRDFLGVLGGGAAAAWPVVARAQQSGSVRRIGALILTAENDTLTKERIAALLEGLGKLNWTIGRNLEIDYHWGIADPERARAAAEEMLERSPDLIFANSFSAARAAQQVTRTIPIVFNAVSEPVHLGLVSSLAQPGGNITGFTNLEPSVAGKWVELLKEIAPTIRRIAVMFNPASTAVSTQFGQATTTAARRLGLEVIEARTNTPAEIDTVLAAIGKGTPTAVIILPDTFLSFHHKLVIDAAARHRLPAIYPFRYYPTAGGLMCYGPDLVDQFRRSGEYIGRIFHGEKPGSLPVQQPVKFDFVINLGTAKTLGLTVPASMQQLADEVIE
jgi:putative ABC transport system substrate-binding protein